MGWLLATHVFSCFALTGLIWTIQLVHYPAFHFVDSARFTEFHGFHSFRITLIVMPLMAIEAGTALFLALERNTPAWWANLAGVAAIWALTAFVSVPIHGGLAAGAAPALIARLVATNWPRTLLWSVRAVALVRTLV